MDRRRPAAFTGGYTPPRCADLSGSRPRNWPRFSPRPHAWTGKGWGSAPRSFAGSCRKLRALGRRHVHTGAFDDGLEALMRAEGLAMRPGPRTRLEDGLLSGAARSHLDVLPGGIRLRRPRFGSRTATSSVDPYAVLYGNRPYLVGYHGVVQRTAALAAGELEQHPDHERHGSNATRNSTCKRYAERSFGMFQEPPIDVVLRFDAVAAPDAEAFVFHPEPDRDDERRRLADRRVHRGGPG